MRIRSITLDNVRRFTAPARVEGIGDRLNVLCEPNEHGKSTLFDAIQALFFKPHGSRDKEVSSLRPHAGGAPEVTIEIETGEGRFTLAKRWLQKPAATVHRDGRLIAQSNEAEAWIAALLGGDAGGPSGLIWVRQGMTDLTGGTKKEQDTALEARRDLMTSVGAEVEALTGGRRMDMALARCREELETHATGKNRNPRKGGPWHAAQQRVEELIASRDALAATARDLHEALDERKRARRDLSDWEAPDALEARRVKLETARSAHAAAERHAEAVESETRKLEMARLMLQSVRSRLDTFRESLAEQTEAAKRVDEADAEARANQAVLERQRDRRDAAERAFAGAQETLKAAELAKSLAQRAQAAKDGADRRRELGDRIARAEQARSAMETAAVAARSGPDAEALRRIEALAAAHATAIVARNATATQVVAHYALGRDGAIRAGDTVLSDGHPLPMPRAMRLTIDGVGELEVRPGEASHDDDSVEAAARKLSGALSDVGAENLDMARASASGRAEATRQHGEARAVLASLAPDGIDRLREALAEIPQLDEAAEAPDPDEAEAALDIARAAHDEARAARETASEQLADARNAATRSDATLVSLRDRLKRADEMLAKFGSVSEDALADEAGTASGAYEEARAIQAEMARNAPDLASTRAALTRAESVERQARDEIARLKPLLARLDERISRSSGDAVEERLVETGQELEAARIDLARMEHEVAVLIRLEKALETARNEARERYFTPIARELKPLLHLLWPEAELTWGEESLLPDALIRNGQEEPIDILSGGTQEQIALLVRLAFARMLAASGRIAPVILDDALVYTDDDRIERMFDALHRQAGDLQIIVLTCRQRAFRALGGNALRLSQMTAEAAFR
ncbi:MAG: chromosome segregation protein SMC [Pseudooceanicola sp.]|nr:chromosome segregation protein SMC [Sedimentitalea sp.]MCB1343225.1 chromosome segregation protein SMC [Pseudooceanicola sp.]